MITPKDIETKVFSYSVRGYNKREVDEFLDQIMIDYQALLDQNDKMMERIKRLQSQVTSDPKNQSEAIAEAKKLMNDISASAEQRAGVIIQNAEQDAANIVSDAKSSTTQAGEELEKLREKIEKFKRRYKAMLQKEIERVDDESADLLEEMREDFYPESIFDDDVSSVTRATGIGVPSGTIATAVKDDEERGEHEELDLGEFAPESEQKDASEESDPLLQRADEADVNVEDLPGFRSSSPDEMKDTVIFKGKIDDTMELEGEAESAEPEAGDAEADAEYMAPEEAPAEKTAEAEEPEAAPEAEAEEAEAVEEVDEVEAEIEAEADSGITGNTIAMDASEIDVPEAPEEQEPKEPPQTREERVKEFKETASKLVDEMFSKKK